MAVNGGITNAELLDLTRTTLPNLPDLELEVALKLQDYPVCNQWFKSDKVQVESGTSIERYIILDTSGNARHVRLYQKTPVNVTDVHQKITAPWCQVQTHWSIERREALRNRKPARFIDLLQGRRIDATLDLADLLEMRAWACPQSSSDDLNPRGVPYWLSMRADASESAGGFDAYIIRWGGTATPTTNDKGGIDASVASGAKWRNWAFTYTAIDAEFVRRLRKAFHATNFKSPMLAKDLEQGPASQFRLYMDLDTLTDYEDLVTKANDNLGKDLDPFHGITTFKRTPIIYVPALDGLTTYGASATENVACPVYGINHAKFFPMVQDGDWMKEDEPMRDLEQHNVVTTFIDSSYQYFCNNVRVGGFVGHKKLTA